MLTRRSIRSSSILSRRDTTEQSRCSVRSLLISTKMADRFLTVRKISAMGNILALSGYWPTGLTRISIFTRWSPKNPIQQFLLTQLTVRTEPTVMASLPLFFSRAHRQWICYWWRTIPDWVWPTIWEASRRSASLIRNDPAASASFR